jgi:hypothetical protein
VEPLEIRVPFYAEETIGLVIVPSKLDPNSQEAVKQVWNVSMRALGSDSLIKLYQRCQSIVRTRIGAIADPSDVSVWDVRAVYRYLEVAFALTKLSDIHVAPEALRVRESLAQWIDDPSAGSRVEGSVSRASARKLVADLEQVEVPQYTRLYGEIAKLDCPQRLPRLQQFRAAISDIAQTERRAAIYKGLGLDQTLIQLAINQCSAALAGASGDPGRSEALLQSAIRESERAREATGRRVYRQQLERDLGFLNARLESLRGGA